MNSYSENLHSSVLATLGAQEMNNKQLSAQLDASMFALYYSEGAEIVAIEKLGLIKKLYKKTQAINDQAVKNKNMSDNLLLSANDQKEHITQSITNMAVSASNIQIATNAVVRLASDVGSIFSIVNAADYGTQIFQQCIEAYNLINKTAYNAEVVSQLAMESSASIAEVATTTIADKAKLTNDSVNNLLQVTTTDLANAAAKINADTEVKYNASIATRSAEGIIKCGKVRYEAAKKAYKINNKKLNQNLIVQPHDATKKTYSVSFNYFKPPFDSKDKSSNTISIALENAVKSYNIILVKESKKSFFSISTAEELLTNSSQHIEIPVSARKDNEDEIIEKYKLYYEALKTANAKYDLVIAAEINEKKVIDNEVLAAKTVKDSKIELEKNENLIKLTGERIHKEKNQIAKIDEQIKKDPKNTKLKEELEFVKANLKKSELELTALKSKDEKDQIFYKIDANHLEIAKAESHSAKEKTEIIRKEYATENNNANNLEKVAIAAKMEGFVTVNTIDLLDSDNDAFLFGEKYVVFLLTVFTENYKKEINTFDDYLSAPSEVFTITNKVLAAQDISVTTDHLAAQKLNFTIQDKSKNLQEIEYRCLFLPYPDYLLTNEELNTLESKIEILEEEEEMIAFKNEINQLNEEIKEINKKINSLEERNADLEKKSKTDPDPKDTAEIERNKQKIKEFDIALKEAIAKLQITTLELKKLELALAKTEANYPPAVKNSKTFFFNLSLAENIAAGNYTIVTAPHREKNVTDPEDEKSITKLQAKIDYLTTDNFGNPLIEGTNYIPVVLSYYNNIPVNKTKYTNTLSNWENTDTFRYSTIKKIN